MDIHIMALASEPSGWRAARVSLGGSLAFAALYAYFELLHTSGSVSLLVLGAAAGLSGVAELLPKNRRRSSCG
ncbi:hypothetical protein HYG81_09180 [Natrinema zhouii]|uniref:hypothetical protein n=1 Tax=Natrinema zhouii TaxID=1710539 RepID=UPI001CF7CA9A|nr:hypothetical protein [Natrinema zhouii]UHQ97977.1 hypothetical protein HYG81_09180 [Natrinema zhouii]